MKSETNRIEFKKESKIWGIKRGYYFKGEFLSKYKTEAMQKLREPFKDNYSDENKKKFPDEWEAIHYEWEKSRDKTKRINEKILLYREARRERRKPMKIKMLEEDIKIYQEKMNEKMRDIKQFYEARIKIKEEEIKKLNGEGDKMICQECGKSLTNEEDCYGHDCEVGINRIPNPEVTLTDEFADGQVAWEERRDRK